MYLEHFELTANPFSLSPKLDFLFKSTAFEESMAHLVYGVDNSEAIVMITGSIGTGKTMALHSFLTNLGQDFHSALVTNTQMTSLELLKLILEDLGIDFPVGCDKSDLIIRFKEFLLKTSHNRRRVVIVIDEAQNLAEDVLEEVRLLTNLGQGETQPVQIVLVGQPELEDLVNREGLAQLRQRIRVHYRLEPLSRTEIEGYLVHRMGVAGCERPVFGKEAIDLIFRYSGGVPRLVNSLAGNALLSAFVAGRDTVQAEDVDSPEGVTPAAPAPKRDEGAPPEPVSPPVATSFARRKTPPRDMPAEPAPTARRRSGGRRKRIAPGWIWGLVLILTAAGVYFTGILDGLLDAGSPEPAMHAPQTDQEGTDVRALKTLDTLDSTASAPLQAEVSEAEVDPGAESLVAEVGTEARSEGEPTPRVDVPAVEFHVHIASFQEEDRAASYTGRLKAAGQEASWEQSTVFGKVWYRVYLGPFPSELQAEDAVALLKQTEKIPYHMVTRRQPRQEN